MLLAVVENRSHRTRDSSGSGKEERWEGHHGDGCQLTGHGNKAGDGLRMAQAWQLRARGSHPHLALEIEHWGN